MCSPGGQPGFPTAVYRKAHVVAIVPWIVTRDSLQQRRTIKSSDLAQQLLHYRTLPGQLCFVPHVLELASTASAKDWTGRLFPKLRSLVYLSNPHARGARLPTAAAFSWTPLRCCLDCDRHPLSCEASGYADRLCLLRTFSIQ